MTCLEVCAMDRAAGVLAGVVKDDDDDVDDDDDNDDEDVANDFDDDEWDEDDDEEGSCDKRMDGLSTADNPATTFIAAMSGCVSSWSAVSLSPPIPSLSFPSVSLSPVVEDGPTVLSSSLEFLVVTWTGAGRLSLL